jgi:hypothetical protein
VRNILNIRDLLRDLILRIFDANKRASASERLLRTLNAQQRTHLSSHRYIDGTRTPLTDTFFSTLPFDSTEDLLTAVASMELSVEAMAKCHDLARDTVLGGWIYWVLYIKGYLQYKATGTISGDNVYYDYLTKYFGPREHDPGLIQILANPASTTKLIARRFRDFDLFRSCATHKLGETEGVDPVIVILSDPPPSEDDAMLVYEVGSDAPLRASIIDGYHRLFLAKLFEVRRLPGRVLSEK